MDMSPFESKVQAVMTAASVEREKAIAVVRANFPGLEGEPSAPRVEPKSIGFVHMEPIPIGGYVRNPDIDEDEEQVKIEEMFRAYGAVVYRTSQKRPSKVSRGIADLIVMFPTRGFSLWWETKRQIGGKQRPDQAQFERDCRDGGWTYRLGDRYDVARYLLNLGLAEEGDGPLGIVPARMTRISLVLADRPE